MTERQAALLKASWSAAARRKHLAEHKLCINGERHGKATHGVRCAWCFDVHKRGLDAVLAEPRFKRPRGYRPKPHSFRRWRVL